MSELGVPDDLLDGLLKAPESQMDPAVKPKLEELRGLSKDDAKPVVLKILDEIVYASLASDFVVTALHVIWLRCGGSEAELRDRQR